MVSHKHPVLPCLTLNGAVRVTEVHTNSKHKCEIALKGNDVLCVYAKGGQYSTYIPVFDDTH